MSLSDKRWLHADERGSIVAVSDGSGTMLAINSYDEFGIPAATNMGRFGYTGQTWLAGIGLWHYKARMYSPTLGRFMQTDPIGYGDGMNMYGYVGNDPINRVDPTGLSCEAFDRGDSGSYCDRDNPQDDGPQIIVTGDRNLGSFDFGFDLDFNRSYFGLDLDFGFGTGGGGGGQIVVSATGPRQRPQNDCTLADNCILVMGAKPTPNFLPPTNPPQAPPTSLPPNHRVRVMPPTSQYPNGYWVQENGSGQPVDPSTGRPPGNVTRPEGRARTHIPLPPGSAPSPLRHLRWAIPLYIICYAVGICDPDPLN